MNILAIESSCDETAAAIVSGDFSNLKLLSSVVVSQIDIFKSYGGVIPEVAARSHLEAILPVIHQAFQDADFITKTSAKSVSDAAAKATNSPKSATSPTSLKDDWSKIDAIAVTHTPGLLGSLLIGTLTARTLAILHHKPLYAVHHLKSHIYANWLTDTTGKAESVSFPLLSLVISGGHTQIIRMTEHNNFNIIGTTHDDAVGECFDKVAKILGLPYPGGPSIAAAAKTGDPKKYHLPHPKVENLDFSFSGLKTAVLRAVQKAAGVPISYPSHQLQSLLTDQEKADFAASFQETAVDILLEKLQLALKEYPDTRSIIIAGGVSANQRLRKKAAKIFPSNNLSLTSFAQHSRNRVRPTQDGISIQHISSISPTMFFPEPKFSGDNAAMVGAAALYEIATGVPETDPYSLSILPRSAIK